MKITQQLSDEHQTILRAINILKAAAASWKQYQAGAAEDCRALLEFFKIFADQCHHSKEERVLFLKLVQVGVPVDGGPIGVMLHEHDEGRQFIRGMEQALDGVRPNDFELYANRYAELLQNHIAKEDGILFPKADELLSIEDDEVMSRRFEAIEAEMGPQTHERFHELLLTLASRYLVKPAKAS